MSASLVFQRKSKTGLLGMREVRLRRRELLKLISVLLLWGLFGGLVVFFGFFCTLMAQQHAIKAIL